MVVDRNNSISLVNMQAKNFYRKITQKLILNFFSIFRLVIYGWKEINDDNFIPALHMFSQLKHLDFRGTNITVKSCREAALTLPMLKFMDVIKNHRVKKAQVSTYLL